MQLCVLTYDLTSARRRSYITHGHFGCIKNILIWRVRIRSNHRPRAPEGYNTRGSAPCHQKALEVKYPLEALMTSVEDFEDFTEHEACGGEVVEGGEGLREAFVVSGQAAESCGPSEASLGEPSTASVTDPAPRLLGHHQPRRKIAPWLLCAAWPHRIRPAPPTPAWTAASGCPSPSPWAVGLRSANSRNRERRSPP